MSDWYDDGARLLVPVEVEAVEGWDPSPPLPPDWEPTWYDTEDLMAVLEPELVAAARASRTEALKVPAPKEDPR